MRKSIPSILLVVVCLLCQSFIFESNNHKAIRLFRQDLKYIETCLKHQPKDSKRLLKAIDNVEQTTSIRSEAGADFFGRRFYPTKNDIRRWQNWLKENKPNLRWDKVSKEIYLKKEEKKEPVKYYQI